MSAAHGPLGGPWSAGERSAPPSGTPGRNGPSAASAAAFDVDGIDLDQAIAELRLGELSFDAALDGERHHLPVSSGALLDLDKLFDNLARVIAGGLNDGHERLTQVLLGIDRRLNAIEQHGTSGNGAAVLARFDRLAESLAEMRRELFQAEDGRRLGEAATGLRAEIAGLAERLAAQPPPPVAVVDIETVLAAIAEVKKYLAGLVKLLAQKL